MGGHQNNQAAYNPLHGLVYEGVWKNYSESPLRRWIWTLTDFNAFLCLACLSILIAFAQTRAWILVRYIIYQRTKSPMLEGDENRDYRQTLSQGRAISESLPSLKIVARKIQRKIRRSNNEQQAHNLEADDSDSPVTSPWFGVFALFNMILFITIGVLLPWVLSDGSLEAPIVTSKSTESCLTSLRYQNFDKLVRELPRTDAILQQCQNRLEDVCSTQFYLRQPIVRKQHVASCPFPANICLNTTMPVEMTHWNITPYEVGVNSPVKLIMNHRLTCAPIDLLPLTYFTYRNTTPITLLRSIITAQAGGSFFGNYSMMLETLNGPNKYSTENSGQRMAKENGPHDVTVLPDYFADIEPDLFHPSIRRADALPFLVIFRAGAAQYLSPEDDPLFSAHSKDLNKNGSFVADHEATALGCAEQFQFCRADYGYCTEWGLGSSALYDLAKKPLLLPDEATLAEIITLFRMMPALFAMWDYLAIRLKTHGMVPLTRSMHLNWGVSEEDPWVNEVETWFMKGILNAILDARYGAQYPLDRVSEHLSFQERRKYSLCGRILFRDGDYTNLNWIGFSTATSLLLLISLVGSMVERIHHAGAKLCGITADSCKALLILARLTTASMILFPTTLRRVAKSLIPSGFFGHFKPPWQSRNTSRTSRATVPTELNNIQTPPGTMSDRRNREEPEDENIDNVI